MLSVVVIAPALNAVGATMCVCEKTSNQKPTDLIFTSNEV